MSPRDHRGLISVVQGEQLLPRPPFLLPHLHPLRPHKVFHQRREEHGARTTRHGLGMRDGTTTRGCTTSISTVNAEGSSRPPVICARRAVRIRQCIRSRRPASLRHHTLAASYSSQRLSNKYPSSVVFTVSKVTSFRGGCRLHGDRGTLLTSQASYPALGPSHHIFSAG